MAETLTSQPPLGAVRPSKRRLAMLLAAALLAVGATFAVTSALESAPQVATDRSVDYAVRHLGEPQAQVMPRPVDFGVRHLNVGPSDPSTSEDYALRHLQP